MPDPGDMRALLRADDESEPIAIPRALLSDLHTYPAEVRQRMYVLGLTLRQRLDEEADSIERSRRWDDILEDLKNMAVDIAIRVVLEVIDES